MRWLCRCLLLTALLPPPLGRASENSSAPLPALPAVYAALQRDDPAAATSTAAPLAAAGNAEAQWILGLLTDLGAGARLDHAAARDWLEKAAVTHALARHYLRWRFATSFGLERPDPAAADRWANLATGSPQIDPRLARWLELRDGAVMPKFSRALLWMMDRAGDGDPLAQANLAAVYLAPQWTTPNTDQHVYWLQQAADHRDLPSLEQLASYYELGLLVPKDPARALALRHTAAEAGSAAAQFALGQHYRTGGEVDADVDAAAAVKWYRLAAAQDHVDALLQLANLLRDGAPGVPADKAEALRLVRKAAARGSLEALTEEADMLREGQGTPQDHTAAAALYETAASRGSAYAADMLGWMHKHGELGPPDFAAARTWFERAAEHGNTHAAGQLAVMYREGLGGSPDLAKAFNWVERAARDGDTWAQNEIGWMLRQGLGQPRDDEEAVTWFRLAAKNGEPHGDANLAYHYLNGLGVPTDPVEAARHVIIAARALDEGWIGTLFHQAYQQPPPDRQVEMRALLQAALDDPRLIEAPGNLPELCLGFLERSPSSPADRAAAQKLLGAMKAAGRPQSRLAIAWHAFTGLDSPYDLEVARTFAKAAATDHPQESARMLAVIDSLAADTPDARADARRALHQMAEAGDVPAAQAVAFRLATGFGEEPDPVKARELLSQAFAKSGADAATTEEALQSLAGLTPPPGPPADLSAKIERIIAGRRKGDDAPPVPVYRSPPRYPFELRASGIEGEATILFTVGPDGVPTEVRSQKSTHPLFAVAAEDAVKRWRFAPAWKAGKPTSRQMIQPLTFSLADPAP